MVHTTPPMRLSPREKSAEIVRRLDGLLGELDALSMSIAAAHLSMAAEILRSRLQSE